MHSGFESLRAAWPMNMRRKVKKRELSPETAADVERIENAFSGFRGGRDVCACGQPFARL
jgi:hypothetical protein